MSDELLINTLIVMAGIESKQPGAMPFEDNPLFVAANRLKELVELKAQVQELRSACQLGIDMFIANDINVPNTIETMQDALDATPAQCLAEIRAEAVDRAIGLYTHKFGDDESLNNVRVDIIRRYREYIHPNGLRDYVEQLRSGTDGEYNQLHQQAKVGGCYFDAGGTLRNADGSRSIFDDVDE